MLFLDTYERHLLSAQERTMAQEGRLLAAAIEARADAEGILDAIPFGNADTVHDVARWINAASR